MNRLILFRLLIRYRKVILISIFCIIFYYILFKWTAPINSKLEKDLFSADRNFLVQSKDIRKSLDYIFSDIPHYMRQQIFDLPSSNSHCKSNLALPLVYSDLNDRSIVQHEKNINSSPNGPSIIPFIFHQTWKTTTLPAAFARFVHRWHQILNIEQHSDPISNQSSKSWLHILWTDDSARAFVSRHYPELLDIYDHARFGVIRADIFRLLVLHQFGGLYAYAGFLCSFIYS